MRKDPTMKAKVLISNQETELRLVRRMMSVPQLMLQINKITRNNIIRKRILRLLRP